MAFSYNTRSTAVATTSGSTSSITIESKDQIQRAQSASTTTENISTPSRHYCIALTNNPRMLRKAQQKLAFAAATTTATSISIGSTEQLTLLPPRTRQRTAPESQQQQQQQQGLMSPPHPPQAQQMRLQARTKSFPSDYQRVTSVEQQVVPTSIQPLPTESMTSVESRAYEQNIEEDFKVQIQSILQNYLNKTKRSPSVNLFLDMSSLIKF